MSKHKRNFSGYHHTIKSKDKIRKSLAKFRKIHPNFMKEVRAKGLKKSRETYLKHPEKWKRTKEEIEQIRKTSRNYALTHPEEYKKRLKKMQKINRNRIYRNKTVLEKKTHSKKMRKYYETHKVWNKGLHIRCNTGKTHFKKGQVPYNKNLPSHLQGNWQGGLSFIDYPKEWKDVRKFIRNKYSNMCQLCNKYGIYIHHIDYNKRNCLEENLTCLCIRCHAKTNHSRDYWFAYFRYILNNIKEVK